MEKNNSIYLDDIKYDWVIDCTALQWRKNNLFNISFEPRITHVYKSNLKNFALMIMDGNFFNIFPLKNNLYTLGTPKYSKFKIMNTEVQTIKTRLQAHIILIMENAGRATQIETSHVPNLILTRYSACELYSSITLLVLIQY